jgi:uncharacterized protein YgiM (DUF1202 family)
MVLLLAACAGPSGPATPEPTPIAVATMAATVEEPTRTPVATAESPTAVSRGTVAASPSAIASATVALSPTALPTPEPERVVVDGGGSQGVNLRREPGTDAPVVKSVRDGTEVVVIGADRQTDGRIWRNVQDGDTTGWIVSTALRALPTPPTVTPTETATSPTTVAPPSTSAVAVSSTPTATGQAAAPAPEPTATPVPEQIEVFGAGAGGANVRGEPGTSAPIVANVPDGTRLTIIGGDREVDGRTWRNVRGESGVSGWIVTEVVRSLTTPTPAATATPSSTPVPVEATATLAPPSEAGAGTPVPGTPAVTSDEPDGEPEEPTPEPERGEVYDTGSQGANLRAQPGLISSVLRSVPDGSRVTVVGDDELVDGITWRPVETEDGVRGWLAQEVVKSLLTPTPTPRPNAPGVGAPVDSEPEPEELQTDEERAATPCRPGQIKGDAATGVYYPADRPEYADLRERVRCFDDVTRARASGFLPPEVLAPPSPEPEAEE